MKSSIKILSVIILIAFYGYSICVINEYPAITGDNDNPKSDMEFYFSNISTKLFCYILQKESSGNNYNNLLASNKKLLFNNQCTVIKTTKHLFDSEFIQYTLISGNFLTQLRKTIIIFPFNYFW